jgi:hypothetical protein
VDRSIRIEDCPEEDDGDDADVEGAKGAEPKPRIPTVDAELGFRFLFLLPLEPFLLAAAPSCDDEDASVRCCALASLAPLRAVRGRA